MCQDYGDIWAIVLKDLSQDKQDSNGNNICMTIHAYDAQFWIVTCHLYARDVDDYGQDLCPVYLAALNAQVKKYVERNYPNFHCRVDTACNVQRVVLKVIFDHAYKGNQEDIIFVLNLNQHLTGADGSRCITVVAVAGTTIDPGAVSHLSRAKKTYEKYLSGHSKGKIKRGGCFGCGSKDHLAMNCNKKHVPEVAARIDTTVARMRENNKL